MGRRAYDMGEGDLTDYEYQVPIFSLPHQFRQQRILGIFSDPGLLIKPQGKIFGMAMHSLNPGEIPPQSRLYVSRRVGHW